MGTVYVGCAGWTIPAQHAALFPPSGSHLVRYARRFAAVEINTSFYQPLPPQWTKAWLRRVEGNPRFGFTVPAGCESADLNADGRVDCADWRILRESWTAGAPPAYARCREPSGMDPASGE